jgi:hypothetical protein
MVKVATLGGRGNCRGNCKIGPVYDDNDDKPVWPTWAVGALFRGVRRIHI